MQSDNTVQSGVSEILELGQRWAKAELDGDTRALADMLADDFMGVGPLGFLLDKKAWLGRYSPGALVHDEFAWRDVEVRVFGAAAAIAIGTEEAAGNYAGHPVIGRCRATHVLIREGGTWILAGMHVSAIGPE